MPVDFNLTKTFPHSFADTYRSAYNSAKAIKGKILKHDPEKRIMNIQFDKKLYGKYLGDRSRFEIQFSEGDGPETTLTILAYPVNPIGQRLMFGQREGVIPAVSSAFYEEMQKRLSADE